MKKRLFLVPSFLAAGFLPLKAYAMPALQALTTDKKQTPSILERLRLKHLYTLAGHRSHSSHSSHVSHRSSSGGGYSSSTYSEPAPLYSPPPVTIAPANPPLVVAPLASSPSGIISNSPDASMQLKTLPGNTAKFQRIVMQVQTALTAYGYYSGLIDGRVGPECKEALKAMQSDYNLRVTGTITPDVLNAFGIVAN